MACLLAATAGCGGTGFGTAATQNVATPVASAKGPQLGYLWLDSDHTLRPILGVSGSSQIGTSVVPADTYVGAVSSASANLAVLQDAYGSFDLMSLPSGNPASLGLSLPAGASIRLSSTATTALIYTPGSATASLVTGLLSSPHVASVAAPGPIADSAVSDTGSVAFEYAQGTGLAVTVMPFDGLSTPVASIHSDGGLSFLPGRDDLLVADASANSLTLLRSATTALAMQSIQTGTLLKSPSAVGVSANGRWALVANSASQTLVRVDLTTLTSVSVTCGCNPTEAAVLADDGAFRVTNAKTGANWIVDAASTTPRTLFIPALPSVAKTTLIASVTKP